MNPKLKHAIETGNLDEFLRLIALEDDIDTRDRAGDTILMLVVQNNNLEMLNATLSRKPDINATNPDSASSLMIAVELGKLKMVQTLLEAGALVNLTSEHGNTALMKGISNGNTRIVQALLSYGATSRICEPNAFGTTPLMIAAAGGNPTMIDLLLRSGATENIHLQNKRHGDTALHLSVKEGHYDATQKLLSAGASFNVKNSHGESALMLAIIGGHLRIIDLLLSAGARIKKKELQKFMDDHPLAKDKRVLDLLAKACLHDVGMLSEEEAVAAVVQTSKDRLFQPPKPETRAHCSIDSSLVETSKP